MPNPNIVTIEKIIPGGSGLARMSDGLVVMVPRVLPGEKVEVKFLQKKKKYAHAELIEIVEPSPMRIEPPCSYYGQCGGCDLQHTNYQDQLQIKEKILEEQLYRHLGEDRSLKKKLMQLRPAQEPFSYRQRLRFQVDSLGRIGFYRFRSKELVVISHCLLAHPKINTVVEQILNNKSASKLLKNSDMVEFMFDQRQEKIVTVFHFTRKPRAMDITSVKDCAAEISDLKSLYLKTKSWGTFGPFTGSQSKNMDPIEEGRLHFFVQLEDGATAKMLFEVGGFCQVNAQQNAWLIQTLLDWADISAEMSVLDLYCGLGNFSIPAAMHCKNVLGMDLQRSAIRSARENAQNNGLDNCLFEQKSAFDAAHNLAEEGSSFDLVILDPPRQGCKEIIPFVEKIAASQVIYISCDPATLARDLKLLQDSGFHIEKIQGLDMFPQTHHIETIVKLIKVSS